MIVEKPVSPPAEASPALIDPLTLGIEREELLKSLVIRIAETGTSTNVSEAGSFLVETDLPARLSALTLRCESSLLLPENGNPQLSIQLGDQVNPADAAVDIELRMIPAISVQPMYNGKPIRPRDLKNPAVRDEFLRQTADVVKRIMRPPSELRSQ